MVPCLARSQYTGCQLVFLPTPFLMTLTRRPSTIRCCMERSRLAFWIQALSSIPTVTLQPPPHHHLSTTHCIFIDISDLFCFTTPPPPLSTRPSRPRQGLINSRHMTFPPSPITLAPLVPLPSLNFFPSDVPLLPGDCLPVSLCACTGA